MSFRMSMANRVDCANRWPSVEPERRGAFGTGSFADTAPPNVTLPTKPELVPQLSMASPEIPSPALPVSSPAPKTSKLEAPVLIKRKDPVYSEEAKEKGISGAVELHFTINAEGNVRDVRVVKGNLLLSHAAIEAVQAWHYQPARLNGIPVEAESSVVVNFRPN
jgi:TonB family protein